MKDSVIDQISIELKNMPNLKRLLSNIDLWKKGENLRLLFFNYGLSKIQ